MLNSLVAEVVVVHHKLVDHMEAEILPMNILAIVTQLTSVRSSATYAPVVEEPPRTKDNSG